jgi:hypothetical protein
VARKDGLYAGQDNTATIVRIQGTDTPYAARLCQDYTQTSGNTRIDDWYLPSRYELNLLYKQKNIIGGFNITNGLYWSSTECTSTPETSAWEQEFKSGTQMEDDKDMTDQVRCIRKF